MQSGQTALPFAPAAPADSRAAVADVATGGEVADAAVVTRIGKTRRWCHHFPAETRYTSDLETRIERLK